MKLGYDIYVMSYWHIRVVLQPSKLQGEYFDAFTTIFFPGVVGPCEV